MDLSVSIVSYNTRGLLERCLSSVFRETRGLEFEVFVTDNASSDGSAEMVRSKFPQVRLTANPENRYFGRAHNQALTRAQGRYAVILNPDLELRGNALKTLVDFMDANPKAGAAGPRILNADGTPQGSGDRLPTFVYGLFEALLLNTLWPSNPVRSSRRRPEWKRDTRESVESLGGACLMVRRALFETVGLLDEEFLLYWEEVDWCRRIVEAGSEVWFVPEAEVVHSGGASTSLLGKDRRDRIFLQSMLYYYRKHGYGTFVLSLIVRAFTLPALWTVRRIKSFLGKGAA